MLAAKYRNTVSEKLFLEVWLEESCSRQRVLHNVTTTTLDFRASIVKISFWDAWRESSLYLLLHILCSVLLQSKKAIPVHTLNYSWIVWQQQKDLDARVKTCLTFSVAFFWIWLNHKTMWFSNHRIDWIPFRFNGLLLCFYGHAALPHRSVFCTAVKVLMLFLLKVKWVQLKSMDPKLTLLQDVYSMSEE